MPLLMLMIAWAAETAEAVRRELNRGFEGMTGESRLLQADTLPLRLVISNDAALYLVIP